MDHWTGERPGDAAHGLDPGHRQLTQVIDVASFGADDHVVGAGDVLGLLDAFDLGDLLGDLGSLADLGLDEDVCRPPQVPTSCVMRPGALQRLVPRGDDGTPRLG